MNPRDWFGNRELVRLPSSVKTVSDESAQAFENVRRRRLQQLGDWHPSSGWLVQPTGHEAGDRGQEQEASGALN